MPAPQVLGPDEKRQGSWILATLDDDRLIERFAQGERAAFERIIALHAKRVARLAQRLLGWPDDVDDVVQEVFMAAWRNRKKFRGTERKHALDAWLNTITVNRCRTVRRRRSTRWIRRKQFQEQSRPAVAPPAITTALDDETLAVVRNAVRQLPVRDREVLVLHYLEQSPVDEVGRILNLSTNAVCVRLHRARNRLKQQLNGFVEDDA